jgi:PAS domain S-box-containing protein
MSLTFFKQTRLGVKRSFFLILLVGVPLFLCPFVCATEPPKKVLILSSEDQYIPAISMVNQAIRTTMRNGWPHHIQLFYESQDSFRISIEKYELELLAFLRRKYEGERIDLIYALGPPALQFLSKHQDELFPNTPIVFVTIARRHLMDIKLGPNITGVNGDVELKPTLDLALTIQPDTQRVVVVAGKAYLDTALIRQAQEEFSAYAGKVEFIYLAGLPFEELNSKLAALPKNNIVFYLAINSDNAARMYNNVEVLAQLASSANAPIYSASQTVMGSGIVGGRLIDFDAMGNRAGHIGLRILAGENPQNIAVETIPNSTMMDWRQLRRWNIDQRKLPADSVIRFREPTFWEQYKWRVIGVLSLLVIQAVLIVFLLVHRARRRNAERETERFARLLEAQHRRLDEVVSNVPGVVWETRIDPASGESQTEFVSRYIEKMLGYGEEDFRNQRGFGLSLIPVEDRVRVKKETDEIIASKKSGLLQFCWKTKDGRSLWVEVHLGVISDKNGEPIGLRGVTMDITDRREAEVSLRASEARFRIMADSAPVMIWMAGPDQLYSYFNQGWLAFTGRAIEEELGTGWTESLHPDDYDRILGTYTAAFQRREPFKVEYRRRRADGVFRWIYDSGTPRIATDGEFLGYIGSCIDISDRREAEEALKLAHEEVNKLKNQLEAENVYLQEEIKLAHHVDEIVGDSDAIKYVLFKIEQVGQTDSTVLILGETGTGKELVARAIHNQSRRKDRPLVKVNCAALSASLIESELFGHEKGSFTGASARKIGRFELADGATIFLDEIGELPLELQAKLLRVVQEGEFERLGSTKTIKVDARILAATNRDLKAEVEKGNFREDLWYRLNVFPISVPPLRQRKEDVPQLVEHFVSTLCKKAGKNITEISAATSRKLQNYRWPGNVRELANVIERSVINTQGSVLQIFEQFDQVPDGLSTSIKTLEEMERDYIGLILDECGWRIEGPDGAATRLGLNPSTLRTRMVKLGIQRRVRAIGYGTAG